MNGPVEVKERSQRGRLIRYREWYPDEAESLCRQGAATADVAAHFGVHERTIRSWAQRYPDFGAAMERGRAAATDVDRAIFKAKKREERLRAIGEFRGRDDPSPGAPVPCYARGAPTLGPAPAPLSQEGPRPSRGEVNRVLTCDGAAREAAGGFGSGAVQLHLPITRIESGVRGECPPPDPPSRGRASAGSTSPQGGGGSEISALETTGAIRADVTLKGEIVVLDRLSSYRPYTKQAEFHALGASKRERLLMAANRVGKTQCGAAEMAMHLTGRYPNWWAGKRFNQPVRAWAAGITSESSRDVVQAKLIGPPERSEAWGAGMIPPDCIKETFLARSVAHAIDTLSIRHVSGGFSSLQFKSYEKGREKWQGTALEVVWFDEEPPLDIYLEGLTRTNETGGIVYVTFTPVLGHTDVVNRFLKEPHDDRAVVGATIFDAGHFTPSERERIIASYPAHQRDARVKGIPVLGTGHVFPVNEERIVCEPFAIPVHWAQINGLDFGWDHPFGAVNCAWDRDADVFYVCKEYRQRETTPLVHAGAVKPWGDWIPCAWPHDGLQHDKGSGEELARAYRNHGLNMLHERATFEDGSNGVEAGVLEMLERMVTGRWKVFSNLSAWLEEFRLYHRAGGRIVKANDDLISASRYAYMMRRFAATRPRRNYEPPPRGPHGWMA